MVYFYFTIGSLFLHKVFYTLENQSVYNYSKAISEVLINEGVKIDYFRVINMIKGKCKEHFPLPNSSFNEIIDMRTQTYEKSLLRKFIEKKFPVFLINRNENDEIDEVEYYSNFSFDKYKANAEAAYLNVIDSFEKGDESAFMKAGEKKGFHVRPKAVNSEDMFEFTNGKFITKRTFWANKETVESIVENLKTEKVARVNGK